MNRSAVNQLFTIRQTMKKGWEFDTPLFLIFVDFKQAYDRVQRKFLYKAMEEINIPPKLISISHA